MDCFWFYGSSFNRWHYLNGIGVLMTRGSQLNSTQRIYGDHQEFKLGLSLELTARTKQEYLQALSAYKRGAKDGHYLSQVKVSQASIRKITVIPLTLLGLFGLVWGLLSNQFWIGSLLFSLSSILLFVIDYQRYWYKPGFAYRYQQGFFYVGIVIFLPLSGLLPYLNGVTYFPLVGLLVIGFSILASGIILLWTTKSRFNLFVSLYGLGIFIFSLAAYQIPSEDIKFSYREYNGGIEITRYRSSDPSVVIPTTLNNQPVISIAFEAFANTDITDVYIGNHIQEIGNFAFAYNRRLTKVWIEDSVPLSPGMFAYSPALNDVRLPTDAPGLPYAVFLNAGSLTSIELPTNITFLGSYALSNTSLSEIQLPSTLIQIGAYALSDNPLLASITIPNSVSFVGEGVLANNEALTFVQLSTSMQTIPAYFLANARSLLSFDVPTHINTIGNFAFENARNLVTITLHDGIRSIGKGAFRNNESLEEVILPRLMTIIADYTFTNAFSLTSVTLPENLEQIGVASFQNNQSLYSIEFPSTLKQINTYAFENTPLATVVLPDELETLGEGVFANNRMLTTIIIPDKVTIIAAGLFQGAINLHTVNILGNITSIEMNAFRGATNLSVINFPDSLTSIGSHAFFAVKALTSIILPEGLTIIESYAFFGMDELREVALPLTLTRIEDGAFGLNKKLTTIYLSIHVAFVGHYAFYGCESLTIYYQGSFIPTDWMSSWNPNEQPVLFDVVP
jgi:hypothetical protein